MKTFLVPIDFSEQSETVVAYAAQLAHFTKAKLILFHAYHPPVMISEMPDVIPIDQMHEMNTQLLQNTAEKLRQTHGEIDIDIECKCGFAVDEIQYFQEKNPVDLIIMGMRGAGYLSERLIGSITTSMIYKSSCPVLAIAENLKFKPLKKIVLACDFTEITTAAMEPLKAIAKTFQSHIYMLNIIDKAEKILNIHDSPTGIKLEKALDGIEHSIHYSQNNDVVDGINDFVQTQNMDMVVMIPRVHSFLENLFQEPNTKKMAFHTNVPLLALHGQ